MMDFLRRLAPAVETDATRAVAVLPSRFSRKSPLLNTSDDVARHDPPAQSDSVDGAWLSPHAASPLATNNNLAALGHSTPSVQPSRTTARPLAGEPSRPGNEKVISPASSTPAEAPRTYRTDVGQFHDRNDENLQRDKLATAKHSPAATLAPPYTLHNATAPLAASHPPHQSSLPPSRAGVTLPLSQAALAQRTLQSQDESQIVHVTIGRIDVVTNTTPAPAAARTPPPRQATVSLADYLRNGSHR